MFSALANLLNSKSDTLTVQLSLADNNGPEGEARYRANLFLKSGVLDRGAKAALAKPVTVVATVAELDGPDFVAGITKLRTANLGVKEAFDAAEAERKAESDAAKKNKSTSRSKSSPSPKPAAQRTSHSPAPLKSKTATKPSSSKASKPKPDRNLPAAYQPKKAASKPTSSKPKLSGAAYRKLKKERELAAAAAATPGTAEQSAAAPVGQEGPVGGAQVPPAASPAGEAVPDVGRVPSPGVPEVQCLSCRLIFDHNAEQKCPGCGASPAYEWPEPTASTPFECAACHSRCGTEDLTDKGACPFCGHIPGEPTGESTRFDTLTLTCPDCGARHVGVAGDACPFCADEPKPAAAPEVAQGEAAPNPQAEEAEPQTADLI